MKERNFRIKITNFDRLHFKRLMTSGKGIRSPGNESRVHANYLLLCQDILDTRDSQWQKLTYIVPSSK